MSRKLEHSQGDADGMDPRERVGDDGKSLERRDVVTYPNYLLKEHSCSRLVVESAGNKLPVRQYWKGVITDWPY